MDIPVRKRTATRPNHARAYLERLYVALLYVACLYVARVSMWCVRPRPCFQVKAEPGHVGVEERPFRAA